MSEDPQPVEVESPEPDEAPVVDPPEPVRAPRQSRPRGANATPPLRTASPDVPDVR